MSPSLTIGVVLLACLGTAWALWTPDLRRSSLLAKYRVDGDRDVDVAGIRLFLRDVGLRSAPPVVLLHGFGASLQSWDGWAQQLAATHRVICFDLPGFGLTGRDPSGRYSVERGLEVLLALLVRLGLERIDLVGHSLGGHYAWAFAARYPQRVRRLVLVAPDGFDDTKFVTSHLPALAPLIRHVMPKFLIWVDLAVCYGAPGRLTGAIVTRYSDMLRAPGVRAALLARWSQIRYVDPRPGLARVRTPTLIVWGTRDRILPPSQAQRYAALVAGSSIRWIEGVGHLPQEEAPLESAAPVVEFLCAAADGSGDGGAACWPHAEHHADIPAGFGRRQQPVRRL